MGDQENLGPDGHMEPDDEDAVLFTLAGLHFAFDWPMPDVFAALLFVGVVTTTGRHVVQIVKGATT